MPERGRLCDARFLECLDRGRGLSRLHRQFSHLHQLAGGWSAEGVDLLSQSQGVVEALLPLADHGQSLEDWYTVGIGDDELLEHRYGLLPLRTPRVVQRQVGFDIG